MNRRLSVVVAALACAVMTTPAFARHHHHYRIVHHHHYKHHVRHSVPQIAQGCASDNNGRTVCPGSERVGAYIGGKAREIRHAAGRIVHDIAGYLPHPAGCPRRAFCGCGAAVEVFGRPVRNLWLAANWYKFPHSSPSAGNVAVRPHHVFVLREHIGGSVWLVADYNSGGHQSRLHARDIRGYTIVNPRG